MTKFHQIFYSRPLFYVAIVFIFGILFGAVISLPLIFLLSLVSLFGVVCLIFFILKKQFFAYWTLFLTIFLFASFLYQNSLHLPYNHISNFATQKKKQTSIKGLIISDPIYSKTVYGSSKTTFILEAKEVKQAKNSLSGSTSKVTSKVYWQSTQGKIRVTLYDHPDLFEYGDLLKLQGELYEPEPPTNPGQFNYKEYLKRKHIYVLLTLNQKDPIHLISQDNGNPIKRYTLDLKHKLKNRIYNLLPKQNASLISAMLLGDREDLSDDVMEDFKDSGTMHILAISGLHVGIIVFILLGFFKLIRVPLRINFLLTLIFIIWYALLTGARPSVVRATIMATILLFGKVIYRDPDIYNSLGLAAIILLLYNPHQIFMAGFILSFMAVLSIVYLTPKIEQRLSFFYDKFSSFNVKRTFKYMVRLLSASFTAWIGLFPIIWMFFNIVSPITIIANLIIIPVAFIIILVSIIVLGISFIFLPLANLFSYLPNFSVEFLYRTVNIFSNIRFGHFYIPDLGWHNLAIFYIGLGMISSCNFFRLNRGKVAIILLVLLNIAVWIKIYDLGQGYGEIEITFLDVGDSDSIFIQFPDGKNMLIDTGKAIPYNSGKSIIGPFLWYKGIKTINSIILTHPDSDHIGGVSWIISHFNVRHVMDNGVSSDSQVYSEYINVLSKYKVKSIGLRRGNLLKGYKNVDLTILHPSSYIANSKKFSMNDKSIVLMMDYNNFNILFCADVRKEGIEDIIKVYNENIDILKVPHHGRVKPVNIILLSKVFKPKAGIISCSENSDRSKLLKNIEYLIKNKTKVYLTSQDGALKVTSDGRRFRIRGYFY